MTGYGYDKVGRLIRVTQPSLTVAGAAGFVTKYDYDEQGNKISQEDALGRVTRWEYDEMGRVLKRILPKAAPTDPEVAESFTYDAVGNVETHTNFNGEVIGYTYDAMNRVKTKTLPGNNVVSYTYTATGQVETVTDTRGVTRTTYDERDRVKKVEHPEGWTIGYTYDAAVTCPGFSDQS